MIYVHALYECTFRLAYPCWMLNNILENAKPGALVYVMYDIACSLFKHLHVRYSTAIECIYIPSYSV